MAPSRIRIRYYPSEPSQTGAIPDRQALVALEGQSQLLVPSSLQTVLDAKTWAGRFSIEVLLRALEELPQLDPTFRATQSIPWHATDDEVLDVDITWPLLSLARDLHDLGLDGEIEIGGA
jgi:hypothetical protein